MRLKIDSNSFIHSLRQRTFPNQLNPPCTRENIVSNQKQRPDIKSDKLVVIFIPVRKGMMGKMKTFYGDVLSFTIYGSEFLVNNIENIRGQLHIQKSRSI